MVSVGASLKQHKPHNHSPHRMDQRTAKPVFYWLTVCMCVLLLMIACAWNLRWISSRHNPTYTSFRYNTIEVSIEESVGVAEECVGVAVEKRFDCFPQKGGSEDKCRKRGCCWQPQMGGVEGQDGVPWCFYSPRHRSYKLINSTRYARGLTAFYKLERPSPYPQDVRVAQLTATFLSDNTLLIKITDAERGGWEVPYPQLDMTESKLRKPLYRLVLDPQRTNVAVLRADDNTTVLDMRDVGGLVLSKGLLQLSALTDARRLYGLGERRGSLAVDTNWTTYTIYNSDTPPQENTNLYGSHPFYVALEKSGKSHGVLMFNSDAMDVVTQPGAVTWRVTGGVLQLLVVLGPSPRNVIAQYTARIGRPVLPPYWSLGFHLCKFNYGSLNATRQVWKRNREEGIPFDAQWNDLDYMKNGNDFTVSDKYTGVGDFVRELHSAGMHYVLLIDPGVSASEAPGSYPPYDLAVQLNVLIRNTSNLPFIGKVWNLKSTVWPDFTHENITQYWSSMLAGLHDKVAFDGAWIDMNEPSNFVSGQLQGGCEPEFLPYKPRQLAGALNTRTLCAEARHAAGIHRHMHNLHAYTEARVTHDLMADLRGTRPFVLSRASSPGLGAVAGHWSGDVASTWHDMSMSIPELLSFSLFGVPLMGADICGFRGNTTRELCLRWMQLGAFYPFSRNHNSDSSSPQDPVYLGEAVAAASRASLRMRYTVLPYLYTAFWLAHTKGYTVATPLWFQFTEDKTTHDLDKQFLLGESLLVCPVLKPGVSSVRAYLPPAQTWYALNGTSRIKSTGWVDLPDTQTVLVKGGSVLVLQPPAANGAVTTRAARTRPLQLLVAPCTMRHARGLLYWDDGDTREWRDKSCVVEFFHSAGELSGRASSWGCVMSPVNRVLVMDQPIPTSVTLNNVTVPFTYFPRTRLLTVYNFTLSLDKPFHFLWH